MTLELITHPGLHPIAHGFFTRAGGASSGVFAGLNCGKGSSDQKEAVAINRRRVAKMMGVGIDALTGMHQVHSAKALHVTHDQRPTEPADALVTATPGLALSVLTADCQPVLFADAQGGIIGAAHAGWKGALNGVLEATVTAMVQLGARRDRITAIIGPSISQQNYEVGPEFRDRFVAQDAGYDSYFKTGTDGRYQFDLPGFGLATLKASGIGKAHWTGHCTYGDAKRFYSYRRSTHMRQADYGRLIAVIRL